MNFISKAFQFILQGVEPEWGADMRGVGAGSLPDSPSLPGPVDDSYFDSDGRRFFHDRPVYDPSGYDSQQGVQNDSHQVTYADMDMWNQPYDAQQFDLDYASGPVFRPGSTRGY